jgi:hypothetical protein
MKKKSFTISIVFISLLINGLQAQLPVPKNQFEQEDSLKYIIKGDKGRFAGKFKEDSLRWGYKEKVYFVVNVKGDTIYRETDPEFTGGKNAMYRFLSSVIKYPPRSREEGAVGKVYVRFMVDTDGSLQDIQVIRLEKTTDYNIPEEFFDALKEESLRVVRLMPRWIPATEQGKPKRSAYILTVPFWLE